MYLLKYSKQGYNHIIPLIGYLFQQERSWNKIDIILVYL